MISSLPKRQLSLAALITVPLIGQVANATEMTVTTFVDELNADGDCSLREAVQAANSDAPVDACPAGQSASTDSLVLPPGTYTLSVPGSGEDLNRTGDLDILGDLQILGPGAILDASALGNDRILDIHGAAVILEGLTLQDGNAPWGGAIRLSASSLSTQSVVFTHNTADLGGAIFVDASSKFLPSSTVLLENQANSGGGLYLAGNLLASAVRFHGNHATQGGGVFVQEGTVSASIALFLENTAERGAGLMNVGGTVNLLGGHFSRNEATRFGGAINNAGDLRLTSFVFANNRAPQGGAVENSDVLEVFHTQFFQNIAPAAQNSAGAGGAISSRNSVVLSLDEVSFVENQSDVGGALWVHNHLGRPVQVTKSLFTRNTAAGALGVLAVTGPTTIDIENSTITGSRSSVPTEVVGIFVSGGTVSILGSTILSRLISSSGEFVISNSILFQCDASIDSRGYNVFPIGSGCLADPLLDLEVPDPLLGPLDNYGGPTATHSLLPSSPAIDAGNPAGCALNEDQRSFPRPIDGDSDGTALCDAGAYEFDPDQSEEPVVLNVPSLPFPGLVLLALLLAIAGSLQIVHRS